jgi:hypothetical protein
MATLESKANSVNPSTLNETLKAYLAADLPIFVWGAPGVGKSSIIRQAAAEMFNPDGSKPEVAYFRDVRAALLDPVDLRGIPSVVNGVTTWNPPGFLPTEGEGVLFLDELPQAEKSVESALLQLILDRGLGEYRLPAGWRIVAAGNRSCDGTHSRKIGKAMGSRFGTHVELEVTLKDFENWALGQVNFSHEILAFLRYRPEMLHQFDPKADANSFPCPRTWEFASKMLGRLSPTVQTAALAGLLGEGPAVEFIGFLRLYRDLPDLNEIILNPEGAPVPTSPASQYALSGAIARKTSEQSAGSVFKYMARLSVEMQVVWLRDVMRLDRNVAKTKEFALWATKHGNLLLD